jgi:hypothetical protein
MQMEKDGAIDSLSDRIASVIGDGRGGEEIYFLLEISTVFSVPILLLLQQ